MRDPLRISLPIKIAKLPDVITLTGLSKSSIYAKMSADSPSYDPCFPRSLRLGERSIGWREDEITDWIQSRQRTSCPSRGAK